MDSEVVFLGACQGANYVSELSRWNIIGLTNFVFSHIFPFILNRLTFAFAFHPAALSDELNLRFVDDSGNEIGGLQLNFESGISDTGFESVDSSGFIHRDAWAVRCFDFSDFDWFITKPGTFYFEVLRGSSYVRVGVLCFAIATAPPLSSERVLAIKSNPNALKSVRLEFGCKNCASKSRSYAGLERSSKFELDGWTWYENLPESFICSCGSSSVDLSYVRQNLHSLLGSSIKSSSDILSYMPLYEKSSLQLIRGEFASLIESGCKEEELQQFINGNPIILHQFPSVRILPKPPITTAYKADFAIVTPQKELILIELERATTRIMKQDGGTASELTHAFDQVKDWLYEFGDHRVSILDGLSIDRHEVSSLKGVVIAGRDVGYDARELRKFKSKDFGGIIFLTYDDLLFSLDALISNFEML